MPEDLKPSRFRPLLITFGVLALAFGLWRGVVAFEHYQASIAAANDPSEREFQEVEALFNGVVALLSFAPAVIAFALALSRRRVDVVDVTQGLLLAVALYCSLWVTAALFSVFVV